MNDEERLDDGVGVSKMDVKKLSRGTSSSEITVGGVISDAGNSELINTGDWRSVKPVFIEKNCKQCLLCCPVCPDSSIPIYKDGKRSEFDYSHCKGCGVCAAVCPFGAIEMQNETTDSGGE